MSDIYFTIEKEGKGIFKEKMSRFLSFAFRIENAEDARLLIKKIQNEYHDARHVCWAYMIGPERKDWQLNDNGEPSGTAGKPILGQINSFELTDVVVIVVRYFGGIKLGTSGLIAAYREAARLALEDAERKEMFKQKNIKIYFPYMSIDPVMRIIRNYSPQILEQIFDNTCVLSFNIREDFYEEAKGRLSSADGVTFENIE